MPVERTLTISEYFAQGDFYFSESQGEQIQVDKMPYPHLVYAMKKTLREYPEFEGTTLFYSMFRRACPNQNQILSLLSNQVSVGYWLGAPGAKSRRQIRGIAISCANKLGDVLEFDTKDDVLYMTPKDTPNITLRNK